MKKNYCLVVLVLILSHSAFAQDEGNIVKRERISRDKSVFVGIGPSFTLGKNIGDYSTGINFEVGFTSRLNRVISIGPSISYLKFNYDAEKTGYNNAFLSRNYVYSDTEYDYFAAALVDFKGGDLSLLSVAFNLKVNLIPVMDDSKISIYGFAKPFLTSVKRNDVKGTAYIFAVPDEDFNGEASEEEIYFGAELGVVQLPWEAGAEEWQDLDVTISDDLKEDTRITGGIFVGPGVEILPAKNLSFYAQAAFGYTFPVSFVSTGKYKGGELDNLDEKFPITEEGFPSVNLQFGVSFNF